jgi:cardiolipin synthase
LPEAGPIPAHAFGSTGGAMTDSVRRMYLLALGAARTNVRLCTAYFVPCSQTQAALIAARRRGVKVEVLVPSDRVDSKVVRPASRRRYGPLLQAGVRIYEYAPAMHHGKILIVDDAWVSLGSANLDNRSFRYSDEANLNLLDPAFAADQVRVFEADKQLCREITFDAWKRRSLPRRTTEALVEPFVPLL